MSISARMSAGDWSLLLLLSLLWGGSFLFNAVAVTALPLLTIVAIRAGGAALALWAFLLVTGRAVPRTPGLWAAFAVMGVLNNVLPFTAFVWAQTRIGPGLASILNAATPLFSVVVAGLLLADERMTVRRVGGVLTGMAGVVLAIGPGALADAGADVLPELACLGGALSYAVAGTFARRFRRMGVEPAMVAAGQLSSSALVLVPLALLVDQPWTLALPGWPVLGSVTALALVSTAFAYILYFRILGTAGATNVMLVTLLIPVTASLLGAVFVGETLGWEDLGGMVLIALGLSLIDGRLWQRG